jgi:hypothetical protein
MKNYLNVLLFAGSIFISHQAFAADSQIVCVSTEDTSEMAAKALTAKIKPFVARKYSISQVSQSMGTQTISLCVTATQL